MFTATSILCNSIKDCLKREISKKYLSCNLENSSGKIRKFCLLEMLGMLTWLYGAMSVIESSCRSFLLAVLINIFNPCFIGINTASLP